MAIQFDDIIYGPIHSRRLGSSLGVNLLPRHGKWCTFDCIYCEIGWNKDGMEDRSLPSKELFREALESKLEECRASGTPIDTITFSGNGEPTLHPQFPEIIDITVELRDKLFPSAKISVLSNATQLPRAGVKEALAKIDNPILKIDSALDTAVAVIDRPVPKFYSVENVLSQLEWFKGNFVLQTMFLKGTVDGLKVDCTDPALADEWVKMALKLHPRQVMMYTIDRETPVSTLEKVTVEEMEKIAEPLRAAGIDVVIKG